MSIIVVEVDNWDEEMNKNCKCGHSLRMHSFVMLGYDEKYVDLRISQCISCGWDREKNVPLCKEFS